MGDLQMLPKSKNTLFLVVLLKKQRGLLPRQTKRTLMLPDIFSYQVKEREEKTIKERLQGFFLNELN
jgi:hypothetical protein